MDKEIVIPEGMSKWVQANMRGMEPFGRDDIIKLVLRWIAENPIVPTREDMEIAFSESVPTISDEFDAGTWFAEEWQRRMFTAGR